VDNKTNFLPLRNVIIYSVYNCSLVYAAPALWNKLPKDLGQFAHPPNPPLNFTLLCYISLVTEDGTIQAILSRF